MKRRICVICRKLFTGYGHNPHPLAERGRCCDECQARVVLARKAQFFAALQDAKQAVAIVANSDSAESKAARALWRALDKAQKGARAEPLRALAKYWRCPNCNRLNTRTAKQCKNCAWLYVAPERRVR